MNVFTDRKIITLLFADVAAEKTQQTLIAGIEKFDTNKLKHTETNEKNPLPDKEGNYINFNNLMCIACFHTGLYRINILPKIII